MPSALKEDVHLTRPQSDRSFGAGLCVCCLKTLSSISRISRRPTRRPSIRLTTIRTYSTIGLIPLGENRLRFQPVDFGGLRQLRGRDWRSPFLVEGALLGLAPGIAVIVNAPSRGLLLAMGLPATKGTAQVVAAVHCADESGRKCGSACTGSGRLAGGAWRAEPIAAANNTPAPRRPPRPRDTSPPGTQNAPAILIAKNQSSRLGC